MEVTAKQLRAWFADAIKERGPVPDIDRCAELAERINQNLWWFGLGHALRRAGRDNNVVRAVQDARRLRSSLQRVHPDEVNLLLFPGFTRREELQRILTSFLEPAPTGSRWQTGETKSDLWIRCDKAFTPHIVSTLRNAEWRKFSATYTDGPVIAVLSKLIRVVTGEEPDRDSLGSTLRQNARKRKAPRQK
jgi:hypothetical protein